MDIIKNNFFITGIKIIWQIRSYITSLYISRMIKLVNQKNKLKCSLIFDEFPTIYFNNIDSLIATARSNKVATTLAVQDYSQLKRITAGNKPKLS